MNELMIEHCINNARAQWLEGTLEDVETTYHSLKALPSLPNWENVPVAAQSVAISLKWEIRKHLPEVAATEDYEKAMSALNA